MKTLAAILYLVSLFGIGTALAHLTYRQPKRKAPPNATVALDLDFTSWETEYPEWK